MPKPMEHYIFDASELIEQEPAQLFSKNKKAVYELACPPGGVHKGKIKYSRWESMELPNSISVKGLSDSTILRAGYYDYFPIYRNSNALEWHVNFADPDLFLAYGTDLLAQDEMQVAEHPVLASLKQKLNVLGHDASTVNGNDPTPILISGAERRCLVKTDSNNQEGRPFGLYGNAFGRASEEVIRKAIVIIDPPTFTNLICISAPNCGDGRYTMDEILYILHTTYTGFNAAVIESGSSPVIIHSGYWGCGAFGGNRILMTWLQALAAKLANVKQLVLHTGAPASGELKTSWASIEADIGNEVITLNTLIQKILAMGFEWGVSDGN